MRNPSPAKRTYVYLHTNGKLITKMEGAVTDPKDYFESDFVVTWWRIETPADMLRLIYDIKTKYSDVKPDWDSSGIENAWNITKADYFQHAVKMAAKEVM